MRARFQRQSKLDLLFRGLHCQRFDDREVLHQLRWETVPFLQESLTIVSDPHLSFAIFPDQYLKGKIDGAAGRRQHDRSACFWISENHELCGTHSHSDFFRFPAMINYCEQRDSLRSQNLFELLDGFVDGVMAGRVNDSFVGIGRHSYLLGNSASPIEPAKQLPRSAL